MLLLHVLTVPTADNTDPVKSKYIATSDFIDAAINSLNSLNSLIKKESYRNKISSFNNPTSSDLGFNLQDQVNIALQPLLKKAKKVDGTKFNDIIQSLVAQPAKSATSKPSLASQVILSSLIGIVANLAVNEKKITRDDIDDFISTISKYFIQYEKLNRANQLLDDGVRRINQKIQDLSSDINEFMVDLIIILYPDTKREYYRKLSTEELFLKFLDRSLIEKLIREDSGMTSGKSNLPQAIYYPGDGIKTAKEITYSIQKLYKEYDALYTANYKEIQSVITDSRILGNGIDMKIIDRSSKELELLYNESRNADVANLRLQTLSDRLNFLSKTEQPISSPQ